MCYTLQMTAARPRRVPLASPARVKHRWLVFVHQLPAHPSNGRVKTWRRLQQIGAVAVKNSVYVLPNNPQAREDFEWLCGEVVALGGQASLFEASSPNAVEERQLLDQLKAASVSTPRPPAQPRKAADLHPRDFQNRWWVTRPRPGVDRFSSAWLIRRFVDARAAFVFAASPEKWPEAVPFDMYQPGGFRHEGDRCTFEVLQERFGIADPAVRALAGIVHDLDLKDHRFKSAHAPTIGLLVEGLRASTPEDGKLLEQGIALFEALYQSLRPGRRTKTIKPKVC